jgi:hypothetical protein
MWFEKLRKPGVAVAAAFTIAILATVDTSFAQTSLSREVTLPDLPVQTLPTSASSTSGATLEPGLLDLGSVASVDAHVMALVSLQAKQVELAKTPEGAQSVAADLVAANYSDWNSSQMSCLDQLWSNESHWNFKAHNYRSGAHGIAQALPADKMEVIGMDWRTNPVTQIRWGLRYIKIRYGTPCKALRYQHWRHGY